MFTSRRGHMRRYVEALRAAAPDRPLPPIVFSALRKKMVRLAGELVEGVVWANAVRSHMAESLKEVPAEKREGFLVGNLAPAYVSEDRGEALAAVRRALSNYLTLPNYKKSLPANLIFLKKAKSILPLAILKRL